MTRPVWMSSWVGLAGLILLLCLRVDAQVGLPPSPIPEGCPDIRLWQEGTPTTNFGNGVVRTVQTNTVNRNIGLEWRLCNPPLPSPSVPQNTRSILSELFATPYWPTCAMVIDNYHICVAGKSRTGDVVLEHWTFGSTTAMGVHAPSVMSYVPAGSPTNPQYSWSLPPRNTVSEVLRASSSQTGLVRALLHDPGSTQHVFVWYDESRSVCRLDLSTGVSVVCAAPAAQAGSLTAPQLSAAFDTFTSGDYAGKGYCLFFTQQTVSADGSVSPALALIDSNRDGTIDSCTTITSTAWVSDGWATAMVIAAY